MSRPTSAPAYYLGRPARLWITAMRSAGNGELQRRGASGTRRVISRWPVPGAEFLEPDDLDQAEPVGVRA